MIKFYWCVLFVLLGLIALCAGCSRSDTGESAKLEKQIAELREQLAALNQSYAKPGSLAEVRAVPGTRAGAGAGAPNVPLTAEGKLDFSKLPGSKINDRLMAQVANGDLERYDTDKDGMLSEEEYLAKYVERHTRRFKGLDKNGDGKLTPQEMVGGL